MKNNRVFIEPINARKAEATAREGPTSLVLAYLVKGIMVITKHGLADYLHFPRSAMSVCFCFAVILENCYIISTVIFQLTD